MTAAPETAAPVTGSALRVRDLRVSYRVREHGRAARLRAIDGVSFTLAAGETLGIVGESGSGKSTLARALLRLIPADSGAVEFAGQPLLELRARELRALRPRLQMIFQDPLSSLDPHMRIDAIVAEPLQVMRPQLDPIARRERVLAMMRRCGLAADYASRYPHECSGGEAQRVGIARALVLEPEVLICDEPISSLDASIRSQIANLLKDLQQQMCLSLIFIAHDLAAVRFSCDRVLVLYLGRVMEIAARDALFQSARHPYTRALIQAAPIPDPRRARSQRAPLEGEIPSPLSPPSGCVFRTRCPLAIERCARETPLLRQVGASEVACHRAEEVE
ncbi:MAG TPA: oligopeptide/dipeptide ABC transporter ATP-binding protein [Steroidobacteraceae bacterium]|nr:oligopeptide/dipeptide ABC transporter ATP-binding protein [Steroidobacteraceae bacterium]